eukprot:366393-Amphidinium_carterae.1
MKVHVYPDRMELLRACLVGPEGESPLSTLVSSVSALSKAHHTWTPCSSSTFTCLPTTLRVHRRCRHP